MFCFSAKFTDLRERAVVPAVSSGGQQRAAGSLCCYGNTNRKSPAEQTVNGGTVQTVHPRLQRVMAARRRTELSREALLWLHSLQLSTPVHNVRR